MKIQAVLKPTPDKHCPAQSHAASVIRTAIYIFMALLSPNVVAQAWETVPNFMFSNTTITTWKHGFGSHPSNREEMDLMFSNYATAANRCGSGPVEKIQSALPQSNNPFVPGAASCAHDNFLAEFTGVLRVSTTGVYGFAVDGDDAVDFRIGNIPVADYYGGHGLSNTNSNAGSIALSAGVDYSFRYRFEEGVGGDQWVLKMRAPFAGALALPSNVALRCSPGSGVAPLVVSCRGVVDQTSGVTWAWKADGVAFGGASNNESVTLSSPGSHVIYGTATNAGGPISAYATVVVTGASGPGTPSNATLTCSPNPAVVSSDITCTANASGSNLNWSWMFYNGTAGTFGRNTNILGTSSQPTNYTVTATAANGGGAASATTTFSTVLASATQNPNLIANGSFEAGVTGWENWGGMLQSTDAYAGSKALSISGATSGGAGAAFAVQGGKTYTLSLYGKHNVVAGTAFGVNFFDSNWALISNPSRPVNGATYTLQSQDVSAPANAANAQAFIWKNDSGTLTVDEVAVKEKSATVATAPTAVTISCTPISGTAPLTVNCTGTATGATGWAWRNGATVFGGTSNTSSTTINAAGSYTITGTAGNAVGSTNATAAITVNAAAGQTSNLIANGSFEAGILGWENWGGMLHSTDAYAGTKALAIGGTTSGGAGAAFAVRGGKTYTMSLYGKHNVVTGTAFGVNFFDSNWGLISNPSKPINGANYSLQSQDMTAPANAANAQAFIWKNDIGTLTVDEVTVREKSATVGTNSEYTYIDGVKCSDYKPNDARYIGCLFGDPRPATGAVVRNNVQATVAKLGSGFGADFMRNQFATNAMYQQMVKFAFDTYAPTNTWDTWFNGTKEVSATMLLGSQTTASSSHDFYAKLYLKQSNIHVLNDLSFNNLEMRRVNIVVAIRGTYTGGNAGQTAANLSADTHGQSVEEGSGYSVHEGFKTAADKLWFGNFGLKSQLANLAQEYAYPFNGASIFITGHSLGGAMAQIIAGRIQRELPQLVVGGVYTFGSPRVGTAGYVQSFLPGGSHEWVGKHLIHFRNGTDIVTHVAPQNSPYVASYVQALISRLTEGTVFDGAKYFVDRIVSGQILASAAENYGHILGYREFWLDRDNQGQMIMDTNPNDTLWKRTFFCEFSPQRHSKYLMRALTNSPTVTHLMYPNEIAGFKFPDLDIPVPTNASYSRRINQKYCAPPLVDGIFSTTEPDPIKLFSCVAPSVLKQVDTALGFECRKNTGDPNDPNNQPEFNPANCNINVPEYGAPMLSTAKSCLVPYDMLIRTCTMGQTSGNWRIPFKSFNDPYMNCQARAIKAFKGDALKLLGRGSYPGSLPNLDQFREGDIFNTGDIQGYAYNPFTQPPWLQIQWSQNLKYISAVVFESSGLIRKEMEVIQAGDPAVLVQQMLETTSSLIASPRVCSVAEPTVQICTDRCELYRRYTCTPNPALHRYDPFVLTCPGHDFEKCPNPYPYR